MSDEDKGVFMRYDINLEEFKKSTKRIEGDVKLRPFDLKPPIWRWMGIKILTLVPLVLYLYGSLLILQMSLFNLILLGIVCVYFSKLWTMLAALERRADISYRTGGFKSFIERENLRYYRLRKVELVGGEMGMWLELQLPEDVEELKKEMSMEERLDRDAQRAAGSIRVKSGT